jgi:hypothetical protein
MFYTRPGVENHGLAYVLPWRVGKHVDGDVRPALLGYVSDESFQTEQVRLTLPEVRDLRRQHGGQLVDVELTPGWIHREREQAQLEKAQ